MKDNLFHSYYDTLENRITEALIKCFKHSTEELTQNFLEFIGLERGSGEFYYDF